ncbi:hypothetical protein AX14_005061 [Amanita brunnescens Koide BX004]|nr:hypothetical protein AX14_005061 [Amanita brunnescens Koide BX004]
MHAVLLEVDISHVFLFVGKAGLSSIVETTGNPDVYIILRRGSGTKLCRRAWESGRRSIRQSRSSPKAYGMLD